MKKTACMALILLFSLALSACNKGASPSNQSSADWAYGFVVWNDDSYEHIKEEVTKEEIERSIGEVNKYSDHEGIYSNGFSNVFRKGTKLYKMKGIDIDQFIAAELDGKYFKLKDNGKYGK